MALSLSLLPLLLASARAALAARANRPSFRAKGAKTAAVLVLLALCPASLPLFAGTPTVNGLFFGDGDLDDYTFFAADTSGGGKGKIYYAFEGTTAYFALVVGKATANDAVFGIGTGPGAPDRPYNNSVGWNNHTFRALESSDHATFGVECGASAATPDYSWGMDLLYDLDGDLDPAEADWRGDHAGPDSPVAPADLRLPPAFVGDTSIAWNLNNSSWDVTLGGARVNDQQYKSADGPLPLYGDGTLNLAGDSYDLNDDSTVAGNYNADFDWEWSLVYEFSFDFSSCTQGISINPGTSHNSPSKDGIPDTSYPDCLSANPPPECRALEFDYGDLPNGYATLNASGGAFHEISSPDNAYLGSAPDSELDGQPSSDALGDNTDLDGNDEDGVTFLTPLVPGFSADISVDAPLGGFLTAWIDFNSDGDFLDAGEQITPADQALAAGVTTINIASVPSDATGVMGARFRITTLAGQGGASPTGAAATGEVEDYVLGCVGDFVWNDLDGDGIQDGGSEIGVAGVTVNLVSPAGPFFLPTFDANGTPISTTTDANGNYELCGLPTVENSGLANPGEYRILFDLPGGFTDFSPPNATGDANDSDADQDTFGTGIEGLAPLSTLSPTTINTSDIDPTVDAGLRAVTAALVTSAAAYKDGGSVVFEFSTGYEALSASFEVYRFDQAARSYIPVTERPIAALLGSPQGGVYQVVDEDAPFSEKLSYAIVEHQADGKTRAYGPFSVPLGRQGDRATLDETSSSRPHVSRRLAGRMAAARTESARGLGKHPATAGSRAGFAHRGGRTHTAQVSVRDTGLYHLTSADLAATLGLPEGKVRSAVRRGHIVVENQGRAVAWLASDGSGDGLYFYGEAIDSLYTLDNTYWLRVNSPGLPMGPVAGASAQAAPGGVFDSTERFEQDLLPSINATLETEADFWFWDGINAASGNTTRTFDVPVPNSVAGRGVLTSRFAGATNGLPANDHHAIVRINGVEVGTATWGGMERFETNMEFDSSLLTPLTTIEVEGTLAEGSVQSIFFIDGFDIQYRRTYHAVADSLPFTGDGNAVVTVEGFSTADVAVFDLSDPALPRTVSNVLVEAGANGFQASFVPSTATTPYLVTTLTAAQAGSKLRPYLPAIELIAEHHSFEHVVIAPQAWMTEAEDLAAHRSSQGLASLAVSIEEVYNAFSWGNPTPWAIRDFLAYARANWAHGPDFAMLAGRGTFDARNLQGAGDSFVPVVLVGTPHGLVSSDNVLADIVGDDSIPEIALGRLPIVSASELAAYVGKLQAYDASTGDWRGRAVLLADNPDTAGDFPAQSGAVAALLSGYEQEAINLSEMDVDTARAALVAAWNDGAQLINYVGHGGVTQAAAEGLLRVSDMDLLTNGDRLPIVSALTCVVGRSDIPNLESLAEALVTRVDGGAIAVWAPAGVSFSGAAHELNLLYAAILDKAPPATPLGRIVVQVLEEFAAGGGLVEILDTYGVVGDPAVQLP